MHTKPPTVLAALSASNAHMLQGMDLGFGRTGAIWSNSWDRVSYERTEGHTLSLYIQGGEGTRRLGRQGSRGRPGAVCIMPQSHSSEWEITDRFAFVHLYMPDTELRRSFTETFDRDARLMVLPDLSFCDIPHLAGALHRLAAAMARQDTLAADAAVTDAAVAALVQELPPGIRQPSLKGGLAPHLMRRIDEYIASHLDAPLRLDDLATMANLSAFHFQRMFRASHGISPHGWIQRLRLERARMLLQEDVPIVRIASACGFSSQSHLTRVFKSATGTTPAAYRAATRERRAVRHAKVL